MRNEELQKLQMYIVKTCRRPAQLESQLVSAGSWS